jgi:hypothetical protein
MPKNTELALTAMSSARPRAIFPTSKDRAEGRPLSADQCRPARRTTRAGISRWQLVCSNAVRQSIRARCCRWRRRGSTPTPIRAQPLGVGSERALVV